MKTGNTWTLNDSKYEKDLPQWSPVMKTGNTHSSEDIPRVQRHASMEPGHEDREYITARALEIAESSCLNGARS